MITFIRTTASMQPMHVGMLLTARNRCSHARTHDRIRF
jgi:hypothetical protein